MVGNMDEKAILDLDSEDTLLVANFCLCFLPCLVGRRKVY